MPRHEALVLIAKSCVAPRRLFGFAGYEMDMTFRMSIS